MAYRHYETEGFIISRRNFGEANRIYLVFTQDFGLINVLAQSSRRSLSKLRYHLETFSFVSLTLVLGREYWRVVGASNSLRVRQTNGALIFFKKISLVICRLIQGEEAGHAIFQDLKQANILLTLDLTTVNQDQLANLEIFIVARLLKQLGYLNPESKELPLFTEGRFSWDDVDKINPIKLSLVKKINEALKATQL